MSYTLYHYVHCPYCVRVRMAFGYLQLAYTSKVLPYDDEATPIALTGKKILPALQFDNEAMNESLDIIALIDKDNRLNVPEITSSEDFATLESELTAVGSLVHSLAMPYWIWTPEFNDVSRLYFQKKKEMKRGPFKDLVKNQAKFVAEINPLLKKIEDQLSPFYQSKFFSLNDIVIAAHIWGLYIVPEFQFSPAVHAYLQKVKEVCQFNYHQDFWS
jgi:glutaredoxin 2